jgi:AcrR family transcriptional regulator
MLCETVSHWPPDSLPEQMTNARQRAAYHHGDLPSALVDAALELIAEQGARGFSVVEAARRTGVSTSAPYRHFADRDELLAATAVRAYGELLRRFEDAVAGESRPAEQLAAVAAAYVRFAAERRAMFDVLFGAGLDKARYPALQQASGEVTEVVAGVAARLVPDGDPELAWRLVLAIASVAHGHAVLLLDGGFAYHDAAAAATGTTGPPPAAAAGRAAVPSPPADAVSLAETRAAATTRALLRGRNQLFA